MSELIEVDSNNLLEENNNSANYITGKTRTKSFTGDRADEKELLKSMGFEEDIINTIYKNINPVDLQEALDYLNTNQKGQFTHSFLVNDNNLCTICGKGKNDHESDTVFVEDDANSDNDNDEENDFLAELIGRRNSLSHRFRAYEDSYRNSVGKEKKKDEDKDKDSSLDFECGICGDKILSPNRVYLKCRHYFCVECWIDYLKEKITNANVTKVLCMQHGCGAILEGSFIKKILEGNDDLLDKYDKFYQRKKLLEQSDKVKFCPFPDCEGYAEKNGKSKYVKCNFGHEFCFECGNEPHGKKKCEDMMDKEFEEWRSHKIVKRCPFCRMWTEKNEGCNHMTCVECKFQWCWLCQKPYTYNHFSEGACNGLQFYKETDEKKIKAKLEENRKKYPGPSKSFIFFCNFWKCVAYIFLVVYLKLISKYDDMLEDTPTPVLVFFYISLFPMFIGFEVFFIIAVSIGTIPLIIYPPYFRRLRFYIQYRLFQL